MILHYQVDQTLDTFSATTHIYQCFSHSDTWLGSFNCLAIVLQLTANHARLQHSHKNSDQRQCSLHCLCHPTSLYCIHQHVLTGHSVMAASVSLHAPCTQPSPSLMRSSPPAVLMFLASSQHSHSALMSSSLQLPYLLQAMNSR